MAKTTNSSSSVKHKLGKGIQTKAKVPKPTKTKNENSPKTANNGLSKKDQIYRYICEQHVMGITEVDKMDAALAVGNRNPRSEGFSKAVKELGAIDGVITKGNKKDTLTLTEKGIQSMPKDLDMSSGGDPSKIHDRYIEFIQGKIKLGSDKVRAVWEIFMDRQAHTINGIAAKLGYNNPRSFANTKIVQEMKKAGLVENAGKGQIRFTDKVPVPMTCSVI